jgi:hypothetical protein
VTAFSDELEHWLAGEGDKTLGGLVAVFEEKSFAVLFVVLLGLPALPLPTGGVTNAFEVIALLLALQLIAGRDMIWLPERWRRIDLAAGEKRQRLLGSLVRLIRRLERFSRPRWRFLFDHRLSNLVFGLVAAGGTIASAVAPPFSGLDTLPALGVVLVSLGVLLEDILVVVAGLVVMAAGITLELLLGKAAFEGIKQLF